MRVVAILFAALFLAGMSPVRASNDCDTTVTEGAFCYEFPLGAPVPAPYADKYYLWFGWADCVPNPINTDCLGKPSADGSGVPTPLGTFGLGQVGLLYQETNGCGGLQRFTTICAGIKIADNMMLV